MNDGIYIALIEGFNILVVLLLPPSLAYHNAIYAQGMTFIYDLGGMLEQVM